VVGLDLDHEVLSRAFGGTDVAGVAGSAYALPVRDGSIDLVLCMDVLEHLCEPEKCLTEVRRVLRPGGFFYLSTPNPASLGARRKGDHSFIYRDPTHCSVLSIVTWTEKLRNAGLSEVWSGTDTLWDAPYVSWLPSQIQWFLFTLGSQLAWAVAPAFRWRHGENFVWLGRRSK
jgi:SAM-dependent methyltransferase